MESLSRLRQYLGTQFKDIVPLIAAKCGDAVMLFAIACLPEEKRHQWKCRRLAIHAAKMGSIDLLEWMGQEFINAAIVSYSLPDHREMAKYLFGKYSLKVAGFNKIEVLLNVARAGMYNNLHKIFAEIQPNEWSAISSAYAEMCRKKDPLAWSSFEMKLRACAIMSGCMMTFKIVSSRCRHAGNDAYYCAKYKNEKLLIQLSQLNGWRDAQSVHYTSLARQGYWNAMLLLRKYGFHPNEFDFEDAVMHNLPKIVDLYHSWGVVAVDAVYAAKSARMLEHLYRKGLIVARCEPHKFYTPATVEMIEWFRQFGFWTSDWWHTALNDDNQDTAKWLYAQKLPLPVCSEHIADCICHTEWVLDFLIANNYDFTGVWEFIVDVDISSCTEHVYETFTKLHACCKPPLNYWIVLKDQDNWFMLKWLDSVGMVPECADLDRG